MSAIIRIMSTNTADCWAHKYYELTKMLKTHTAHPPHPQPPPPQKKTNNNNKKQNKKQNKIQK